MSNLFVHYKGGKYRKLFEAKIDRNTCDALARIPSLPAHHADDARDVMVFLCSAGPLVVDRLFCGPSSQDVVVYVALADGRIWVRNKAEFEGYVTLPAEEGGGTMRRFRPVSRILPTPLRGNYG